MDKIDELVERLRHPERPTEPYQSLGDMCRDAASLLLTMKEALVEARGLFDKDGALFCSGGYQLEVIAKIDATLKRWE